MTPGDCAPAGLVCGVVLAACGPPLAAGDGWGVVLAPAAPWGVTGLPWGDGLGVVCVVGLGTGCGVVGLAVTGVGFLKAGEGAVVLVAVVLAAGTPPFTLAPLKRNTLTSTPRHQEGRLIMGSVQHAAQCRPKQH